MRKPCAASSPKHVFCDAEPPFKRNAAKTAPLNNRTQKLLEEIPTISALLKLFFVLKHAV